ncbi:patatin-like phospholipase family protein [Ampullimonas aquatilis]|uniref:patatin-like phospholipase family protein n=1 Tax=Ampullimonas aquatilis TaxID=1341549 RepID=UPI003C742FA5
MMYDTTPDKLATTLPRSPKSVIAAKPVNLALQGGGSHGAFTWGVLDALLESGEIDFTSVSGTSAGAMNAVVMSYGLTVGMTEGREAALNKAREVLENFWRQVSVAAGNTTFQSPILSSPIFNNPLTEWAKAQSSHFDLFTRMISPYQFNPLNINPLRTVLERTVDFELLRKKCPIDLHICATHIKSGKARIFTNKEINADTVMASACLPFLFQAVEIEGEHYWDGGYTGNPPLFPLFTNKESMDILLVQISPLSREDIPSSVAEIVDRANEISFNMPLLAELRAINFVVRQLEQKNLPRETYRSIRMHVIEAAKTMQSYSADSKLKTDWSFLCELRDLGRETAKNWLKKHRDNLGVISTMDIAKHLR